MKLLDEYFKILNDIYSYFGYIEKYEVFPLDDRRNYYWYMDGGEVHYAKNIEDFDYNNDNSYSDILYPTITNCVFRTEEYTMISVDTQTDGNKFLAIFDNKKEVNKYDQAFLNLTKEEMETLNELIEPIEPTVDNKGKQGKEINKQDLEQYDGQLVWVTFDFYDVTMCGTEEEHDETIERLAEEYPDGVFRVNWKEKHFEYLNNDDVLLYFYHNLIGKIYEWKEN